MAAAVELSPRDLRRVCDPGTLGFATTAELPLLNEVLGQPRAVAAFAFGAGIGGHGFNLFALGQPGSGKTTLIREYLERRAQSQPAPPDLCYVYNFCDARQPLPLRLPAGRAVQFQQDVADFVEELKTDIPKAFESEEYGRHRNKVLQDLEDGRREILAHIEQRATEAGLQLLKGPGGLLLVPFVNGKPLTEQELAQMTPEQRENMDRTRQRIQRETEDRLRAIREAEKGARDALRALDTETAAYAARHVVEDLRNRYLDQPAVLNYLDAVLADLLEHTDDFRKEKESDSPPSPAPAGPSDADRALVRYQVNVLVNNRDLTGAPVVVETNPTYHNLTGRIEHQSTWGGGVLTDHTMIKAGALHRANGGYLIVPARECLLHPYAWEGLKRALKDGMLRIEELGTQLSMFSSVSLDPQPVPLDVKVVLIGSPALYYLLYGYDEDFQKLFKVKADFTTRMPRDPQSERGYALFVNTIARGDKTLPFDSGAVARVIEYGSRAVEDQDQLSTGFGDIADLVREAAHHAVQDSRQTVTAADVRCTEEARRFRQNLLEERLQELLVKGTVLVETSGAAIGRVNGLSVLNLGDCSFGHPVRLTAAVAAGRRGIVSIEREVELSGPIHGKGVLILSGYLLSQYAGSAPLSLSASLVFEQSYSLVDGDSATLPELCVLLSAISGLPLRQDIAVTGSVNQQGCVQAVGGVTEKVEGFFDLCRARGLTGTQGVLLPAANRRNLMLRDDVVEAVSRGRFHIWPAEQVDEAIELLTGQPADQVHHFVRARLSEYAATLRAQAPEKSTHEWEPVAAK